MYTLTRWLQVCGLTLLPLALVLGFTNQKGLHAELFLAGIGAGVFLVGSMIQKRLD